MLFDAARQEILAHLTTVLTQMSGTAPTELILEIPPELNMGDFAFPCFRLAKSLRKAPPQIAQEISKLLTADKAFAARYDLTVAGAYLNFRVAKDVLLKSTLPALLNSGDKLGERTLPNTPTVVMEFSSPNIAKPFNIYHLRSTMIGNCLHRVFQARGYKSIAINHLGDWGTQFGSLSVAYKMWGNDKDLEEKGIPYLVELYVRFHKEMESDPKLEAQAREAFSKLEKRDPEIQKIWKKFSDLSLEAFNKTYARLNVEFDHYWGESFYLDKIDAVEKLLKTKGLLVESEGAEVVKLDEFNMPACIFRKSDGSTIYAARDLAAANYRHEKFNFEKMVYVVGGEQRLHFNQLFKVLELAGQEWAKNCVHIDFGLYRFKDAKMSTRRGNFVTMEAVLDQAVERVREIMKEKGAAFTQQEQEDAAEIIGCGAIIFNDLSTDRSQEVNFDLDAVLDFEGETGPYVQYAHTRCLSILRNAPAELRQPPSLAALQKLEDDELGLIRFLARFPITLDFVLETYKPSLLATYLVDLTKLFNQFYRNHKVLVEDTELAKARLALIDSTRQVMIRSLTLLGMRAPLKM